MYLGINHWYMASDGSVETDRAHVQTYVPAYQKDEWAREAESMGMSLSEYVRTMVQAGRSDVVVDSSPDERTDDGKPAGGASSGRDPQGSGVEDRVLTILESGEFYEWDELVAALTDDVEDRLESALQELQSDGAVQYSGRNGGYTLV